MSYGREIWIEIIAFANDPKIRASAPRIAAPFCYPSIIAGRKNDDLSNWLTCPFHMG